MRVIAGTSANLIWTGSIVQTAARTVRETLSEENISSEILLLPYMGQTDLKLNPHAAFPPPFIISASRLLPMLPSQRGRLCTWTVVKGGEFGGKLLNVFKVNQVFYKLSGYVALNVCTFSA